VKIGDWIDGYLDKYASEVKHFAEREMEMLYINDAEKNPQKVYIPTGDEHGKTSWGELIAVTRHDPGTELYEIKTEGGRKVIVTESKSLLVWKNDLCKFVETPTPEIVVGDFVPTVANLPEPPILTEFVDMKEYFPATEYVYGTEYNKACALMRAAQADRFHIPRGWWKDNNGVNFTIPYPSKARLQRATVRSNTENIRDGCVYPFHADREAARIPDRFDLNYENGVFIGLFLADGHTALPAGSVGISKEEISVREWVTRWFEKHAITHRTISEERESVTLTGEIMRGTTTTIYGNTTLLALFLNKFVGEGSLNKHVPDVAFTAPKEFARGLLSGYFSGDGSVGKNNVSVCSRSYRLIEGISMLCARMGIFCNISITKMPAISKQGIRSNGDSNRIDIRSLWARRFADEITLINKPKQDRLDVISTSKTHCNFPHFHDVVLDRIVDIQVFDANAYPKVYDVTVPSTLNFVLANGLNVRD
jgi:DNA-directed RNA polymerase subunit A"